MNQDSEQCLDDAAKVPIKNPAKNPLINNSRMSQLSGPSTRQTYDLDQAPVITNYPEPVQQEIYPMRDDMCAQNNNNNGSSMYHTNSGDKNNSNLEAQKRINYQDQIQIQVHESDDEDEDKVIGSDYFDEDTPQNINTANKDKAHQNGPKKRHRGIITLAGYILNIAVLLDAMFINSAWFYRGFDNDSDPSILKYSGIHILLFIFLIFSMISFIFRCLGFNVLFTTISTIFFALLNSLGGYIFAVTLYYTYYKKNLTLSVSMDFYGSIFAFTLTLFIVALLVYDMKKTPNFRHRGSGMSKQQMKMQFSLMALYAWSILEAVVLVTIEKVDFYEGVYISFVTMTTIGFGDKFPATAKTKIFTFFWFLVSIILATLYLIYTRDVMAQFVSNYYSKKIHEFEAIKKEFDKNAIKKRNMVLLQARPHKSLKSRFYSLYSNFFVSKQDRSQFETPAWVRYPTHYGTSNNAVTKREKSCRDSVDALQNFKKEQLTYSATVRRMNIRVAIIFLINFIFYAVFSVTFYLTENKNFTYGDSLWFCFIGFTTVGYGDTTLNKKISVVIFNCIILLAVSLYTAILGATVERCQFTLNYLLNSKKNRREFYSETLFGKVVLDGEMFHRKTSDSSGTKTGPFSALGTGGGGKYRRRLHFIRPSHYNSANSSAFPSNANSRRSSFAKPSKL